MQALWVVYINLSVQSRADKVKTESKCSHLHDMSMRHANNATDHILLYFRLLHLFPHMASERTVVAYTLQALSGTLE